MILEILATLQKALETDLVLKCLVGPTLVDLEEPSIEILPKASMKLTIDEHEEYGSRAYEGETYKGRWISVELPVAATLKAEGNELGIKSAMYEKSWKVNRYFILQRQFHDEELESLNFNGYFALQLASTGLTFSAIEQEGKQPFSYEETFEGNIFFRYFDTELETGRFVPPLEFIEGVHVNG